MPRNDAAHSVEDFSIAEVRGICKDLFRPNLAIYWIDFLATLVVVVASFILFGGRILC